MSRISRRSLAGRLEALRVEETLDEVFAEDLAARLQSLAIAASFEAGVKKGRLRRKAIAVVGSIGVAGWIGVTGAAASVGLATTGNLPAPIQDVVSNVFEVVGIDIPTSSDEPADAPVEPVETTVPGIVVDDAETIVEEVPTPVTRPGNSGNTPAVTAPGQVGKDDGEDKPSVTAPGQVGKDDGEDKPSVTAPGQVGKDDGEDKPSVTAPGQVGKDDTSDDESSSPGKSGDAPGQTKKNDD